jgi:hypothetical protein
MADVVGGGLVAARLGRIADRRPDQFFQTNQVADYRKALLSFRHGIAIDHPNLLSTKNTTRSAGWFAQHRRISMASRKSARQLAHLAKESFCQILTATLYPFYSVR